jgi:hypothetical protein
MNVDYIRSNFNYESRVNGRDFWRLTYPGAQAIFTPGFSDFARAPTIPTMPLVYVAGGRGCLYTQSQVPSGGHGLFVVRTLIGFNGSRALHDESPRPLRDHLGIWPCVGRTPGKSHESKCVPS